MHSGGGLRLMIANIKFEKIIMWKKFSNYEEMNCFEKK